MPTKTLINVVFVLMIMLLICFPNSASAFPSFKWIPLPSLGSEALAFDSHGNVYTGLNDGRIVKSSTKDAKHVFEEFATTVRIRSRKLCDATNGNMPTGGSRCGRPLDLEFDSKTGRLYIVDLYRGLMVVGPEGGVATRVSKRDGMPNNAPDAIAIDPITNDVYFTHIGNIIFTNNNATEVLQSGDRSGKLLKYDPKTRKRSVVLTGQGDRSFKSIPLPSLGSEALAFDPQGNVYTGLNDGRIVKTTQGVFKEFATTVPNRSNELCDGTNGNLTTGPSCGRPLDLEFDTKTGRLYIVDLFRGLMVVGPQGGVATPVSIGDGMPINAPDAIAIDPTTNEVYFTLIGNIIFTNSNASEVLQSGDTSGELLKYDPKTKKRSVVLKGLAAPAGAVVSEDGSFILIAEYLACNITRLWLKGPKANTTETFAQLPGNPDNMKRTERGDFWVAVNIQKLYPRLIGFPLGQKLNALGKITQTVNFYAEYNSTYITEVHEQRGSLYVASILARGVGVYRKGRSG